MRRGSILLEYRSVNENVSVFEPDWLFEKKMKSLQKCFAQSNTASCHHADHRNYVRGNVALKTFGCSHALTHTLMQYRYLPFILQGTVQLLFVDNPALVEELVCELDGLFKYVTI
jgi:hypothetical protein